MIAVFGFLFILGFVFGGYALSGGSIGIVLHALPFEGMIIGGAGIGALIIGNKPSVLKKMGKTLKRVMDGPIWHREDYKDLLCLMFHLCKIIRARGMIALETHIENPRESNVFMEYPRILEHPFVLDLICDTLRTVSMGMENPYEIENSIDRKIEKYQYEVCKPAHALTTLADALPAIGIVAAVLGVIKTMASINQPPEILGRMIGGALVGTFLGVFLSYCLVGPYAHRAQQILDEEQQFYFIIRDVLIAHLNGMAPSIAMEIGRGNVPTHHQPSFLEMEEASSAIKIN